MQCNSVGTKCFHILPPFEFDKSNSEKGPSRKGRTNDNSYTNMANRTLVSSSVREVNAMPTAVDTIADLLLDPQENNHFLVQTRMLKSFWFKTGN